MSLGITDEHAELANALRGWAERLAGPALVRAAEDDPTAGFAEAVHAAAGQGVLGIVVPEESGGGGGSVLDVAVALETAAHAMVPGPLLGSVVAAGLVEGDLAEAFAQGRATAGVGLAPTLRVVDGRLAGEVAVVLDAPSSSHLLLGAEDRWFLVPSGRVTVLPGPAVLDLSHRYGGVAVADVPVAEVTELATNGAEVHRLLVTLAAAEASGLARWCLETAVAHAGLREQFGRKIGSFQAVKHLCAGMLETAEAVTAVAWDAATAAGDTPDQWQYAADVAGTIALDGAVLVAQDCIQVLGGIGFTFEHDAHLYLRRAGALRAFLGGSGGFARSLAQAAVGGTRRDLRIDVDAEGADLRPPVREEVRRIASLPAAGQRRALADAGLLVPHWPAPYGRAAGPAEQLVIDEELATAGLTRPDLKVGGWAVPTILAHGTPEQRERFVRPTLYGDLTWCQLFSEPEAGSDLASLRTRAVRDGAGWRLTGQKVWTSLARDADWAICLARTDPDAPRHHGITYFLVDMRSPGIEVRPLREMTGDALFNEVFLDDVHVPDDAVVGEVDGGWALARSTLASERVAMAGTKLGTSVELAVSLAGDADPAARERVGRAVADATACAVLGARSTLRALAGAEPGAESSVAKLLTVRSRQHASELAVELLGPRVLLGDPAAAEAVHEMLLTRCLSIAGGTTQVLRDVVGERLLGLPR